MLDFAVETDDIRRRLVAAMANAGMREKELGAKIGVSQQRIGQIKADPNPEYEKWPEIAAALGCSTGWLLTGEGVPPAWVATPSEPSVERAHAAALRDLVDRLTAENRDLKLALAAKGRRPPGRGRA